jgi:hypothetical protein
MTNAFKGNQIQSIAHETDRMAIRELCSTLKRPSSMKEILTNIKFALDCDLLLQPDFYEEELLKIVFGGETIELGIAEELSSKCFVNGTISTFPAIPLTSINGILMDSLSFSLDRIYENNFLTTGWIRLNIYANESVTYEELICIFGQPVAVGHNYIKTPPHGEIMRKMQTHHFADQTMEYERVQGRVTRSISIDLNSAGQLCVGSFKVVCNQRGGYQN